MQYTAYSQEGIRKDLDIMWKYEFFIFVDIWNLTSNNSVLDFGVCFSIGAFK